MNIEMLKQAYKDNDAVRLICDHMAKRPNNQNETALHRIMYHLGQDGFDFKKSELIAAFRSLEESGSGKYVEGRRGYKSRFVWSVKSKLVAGAAQGNETKAALEEDETPDEEIAENEMLGHSFFLRPNLSIDFELPADLTQGEAKRLSQFIGSLSFEEYY